MKILKGPVHLLESRRIHFPASLAQAFPNYPVILSYQSVVVILEARRELGAYFRFYNNLRPHQALGYRTPAEVFHGEQDIPEEEPKDRKCSDESVLVSYAGVTGLSLNSTSILSN